MTGHTSERSWQVVFPILLADTTRPKLNAFDLDCEPFPGVEGRDAECRNNREIQSFLIYLGSNREELKGGCLM